MSVDASSQEEAATKLKEMMTEEAIAAHTAEKHPGDPVPSVEQSHAMIDQMVKKAEVAEEVRAEDEAEEA